VIPTHLGTLEDPLTVLPVIPTHLGTLEDPLTGLGARTIRPEILEMTTIQDRMAKAIPTLLEILGMMITRGHTAKVTRTHLETRMIPRMGPDAKSTRLEIQAMTITRDPTEKATPIHLETLE
jgi:hypothetical protein